MKITSCDGRSAVALLLCADEHGSALHTDVTLSDHRGVRRYPDRLVCPGGPVEADAWLQGTLAQLVQPGSELTLCDALRFTLVARDASARGARVTLLVQVPDLVEHEESIDEVLLEIEEADLEHVAVWWHERALVVVDGEES